MTAAPHPRLATIFAQALAAPTAERAAVLDRECAGDPRLRREVEKLLAQDASASTVPNMLDGPPLVPGAAVEAAWRRAADSDETQIDGEPAPPSYAPGAMVGSFRIEHEIGRGGFGVVYLAEQAPPERRLVALKIMEGVALSPRLARRFEVERRAQANMNHPGIARIYSGGTTESGHPYLAMEFVADASGRAAAPLITTWADQRGLSVRQRVELFLLVCQAVQHAHQQGVIHRDLKPSNILIADGGQPKVIDFGIARHLEPTAGQPTPPTLLTLIGEVYGTPSYMSPEHAAGKPLDTRTDVYSLGVVLYELLCGCLPIVLKGSIVDQMLAVQHVQPMRPTTAVRRHRTAAGATSRDAARQLVKQLRGDLETILLRALEKDPARRIATVAALADELKRYLTNQPIASRPPTLVYTLTKFVRRHRAFAGAVTVVFVTLVVTTTYSWLQSHKAEIRRAEAQRMTAIANLRTAQFALDSGRGEMLQLALDDVPDEWRGWERGFLDTVRDRSRRLVVENADRVAGLAVDPSGKRLLCGDRDGTASVFDVETRQLLIRTDKLRGHAGARDVWSVAWSPDGTHFATGSFDATARLYRADGTLVRPLPSPEGGFGSVYAVAFHPSKPWLVVGAGLTSSKVPFVLATYDARTGDPLDVEDKAHRGPCNDLAFSRDGQWLATASDDGTVQVWTCTGNRPMPVGELPIGTSSEAVAWSPDGSLLAVGTHESEIYLFEWPSRTPRTPLQSHRLPIASLVFHPSGEWLVSGSWDAMIRVWSVREGRTIDVLPGHSLRVNRVVFAPGGRTFVSGSNDGTVREWAMPNDNPVRTIQVADTRVTGARFLADGSLAILARDRGVHLVDLASLTITPVGPGGHFEVTPDGSTIVGRLGSRLWTWRRDTGPRDHPGPESLESSFGPVDDSCVIVCDHANVLRFDLRTHAWTPVLPRPRLAADHQLRWALPPAGATPWVTFWSNSHESTRVNGHAIEPLQPGHRPVSENHSGHRMLLTHGTRDQLKILDLRNGKIVSNLAGHGEQVASYAFSPLPDDSRLATVASGDGSLRLWDWRQEQLVLTLDPPPLEMPHKVKPPHFTAVTWSRDGLTLVTGTSDGRIVLWPGRRQQMR